MLLLALTLALGSDPVRIDLDADASRQVVIDREAGVYLGHVSTVLMPPCEEPEPGDCPTYGADAPYDTVVETAPETLPDVQPGDVFELEG